MRPAGKRWLGAGLLALAVGCNSSQKRCDSCATCAGPTCATPAVAMVKMPPDPKAGAIPATPTSSSKVAPQPPANRLAPESPADGGLRTSDVPRVLPQMTNPPRSPAPPPAPTPALPPTPTPMIAPVPFATTEESVAPEHSRPAVMPKVADPAPLARATDPLAHAGFYHSPDYTTLVGELHYNPRQGIWRLRFAAADEEDRYGGSVTLTEMSRRMQGYQSGQRVRVEGALVNPESHDVSPAYRVREVRPVEANR